MVSTSLFFILEIQKITVKHSIIIIHLIRLPLSDIIAFLKRYHRFLKAMSSLKNGILPLANLRSCPLFRRGRGEGGIIHFHIGSHIKKPESGFSLIGRGTIHVNWSYSTWLSNFNGTSCGDDGCYSEDEF